MVFQNDIIAGASGAGGGYAIDQSIRFNDNDSAYLEKTYSSSESTLTAWSFSAWVKRSLLADEQFIFQAGTTSANLEYLRFTNSDTLEYKLLLSSSLDANYITSQVFRDPGAWMHIYAYRSSTTFKLYINGSEVTDFSTSNAPGSSDGMLGKNVRHRIGTSYSTISNLFGGYLAEMNFVPGTAKAITDFGETNSDGVWVPKAYTGSYGTNGFYITGETASDLGEDFSGNGNDFTSSGLATTDQMLDTPTDNYVTLNPLQKGSNVTLSDGNLVADCGSSSSSHRAFATASMPNSGKWTFQIEAVSSTLGGTDSLSSIGIITDPEATNTDVTSSGKIGITTDQENAGLDFYNGFTKKDNASQITAAQLRNAGDKGIVAYDASTKELWLGYAQSTDSSWTWVNGGDPETGTTPTYTMTNDDMRFAISSDRSKTIVRFGSTGDGIAPPSGFNYLNTASLPAPSITDGSAHFQPTLYTGTGSARSVDQTGNSTFQPGWVWVKARSTTYSHSIYDEVRGVTKEINSNSASAENTVLTGVTDFENDGFRVGSRPGVNGSGQNFVAWQWKVGGTSGSSNTDGSINTTATSVNTTAGFSISTYTGNATVGATVGHGLGIAPKVVIVKSRSNTESWIFGHDSVGWTKAMYMQTTGAPYTLDIYWNNTAPTSSVVELHDHPVTNGNGYTYVMYAFAEIPGYSSFGTYTGNGSTDGPFVYTGFTPRYVLFKRTNAAESWPILDTARGSSFGADAGAGGDNPTAANDINAVLVASSSAAEEDNPAGSRKASFNSNGFKVRTTNTAMNASGSTYIYMAFAEHPFGGDGVAPATAR